MKKYIKPQMEISTIEIEDMMIITSLQDEAGSSLDIKIDNDNTFSESADGKDRNNWGGLLW